MFLEAQFGSSITPIDRPRARNTSNTGAGSDHKQAGPEGTSADAGMDTDPDSVDHAELARLHALGVPVPGVEIRVDKHVARVWLETLEVECAYGVLRDRVKAVVERAVETGAPLWAGTSVARLGH